MEMINYPWIVNKDIVIVDLVAAEEDTFMLICTGAPVPQKIMRIFFFDLWCPTWDTRGVIRSRLTPCVDMKKNIEVKMRHARRAYFDFRWWASKRCPLSKIEVGTGKKSK